MGGTVAVKLFLWLIMFPALLVTALMVYKYLYQKFERWKSEEETRKAIKRLQDQLDKTNNKRPD